ncbi:male sterility protein-domain-containing protein [Rhizoctonia solani]|nr:male sterility protein-domain-containing protein [Rhizoctonia solani]
MDPKEADNPTIDADFAKNRHVNANFCSQDVFSEPASRRLVQLVGHLSQNGDASVNPISKAPQNVRAMIKAYDACWPRQTYCTVQPVQRERMVVTGTTGALGSHLLAQLLENNNVEKVWAINRRSNKGSTKDRETASFQDKLLDTRLLDSKKLVFVDTELETTDYKLGLRDEIYDEAINFKLSLKDFEPNIRSARNLLNLAFNSTAPTGLPRFAFTSYITAAGFAYPERCLSEVSLAPEDAATGIGYGQNKLVTEKLLESARRAGLQTCIFRIGQLTGDTESGSWSTADLVPSLLASSISIGYLPEALGVVSWLPLDVAARAIIETCIARNVELPSVVHTSHPRPIQWMDIISAFFASIGARTGSHLPILRLDKWNKRVLEAAESFKGSKSDRYRRFPSTKIQPTINRMVKADNELRSCRDAGITELGGVVSLNTTVAEEFSEALRTAPQLGMDHVETWIGYWESVGFFKLV